MLHIDGYKDVIKYPKTQQVHRYPFYFNIENTIKRLKFQQSEISYF